MNRLKSISTLTYFSLNNNSIGSSGASLLSDALKSNSTLTTLNLCDGMIGYEGASSLSHALKSNSTLTELNLDYNSIGKEGASPLSDALNLTKHTLIVTLVNQIEAELTANKGLCSIHCSSFSSDSFQTLEIILNIQLDEMPHHIREMIETVSMCFNEIGLLEELEHLIIKFIGFSFKIWPRSTNPVHWPFFLYW